MKKKKTLNICMVLTIIFAIICGIMAVGFVKGWFEKEGDGSAFIISEKTGIAMIERNGVAYEVTADTVLRAKDKIYTKPAASVVLSKAEQAITYMDHSTELRLDEINHSLKCEILKGSVLVDARTLENSTFLARNIEAVMHNAVATVSRQPGSSMFYVYAGEITLKDKQSGESKIISSGEVVTITDGGKEFEIAELMANNLSDSQIEQLKKCSLDDSFCFSKSELKKVKQEREAEKEEIQDEVDKTEPETKTEVQDVKEDVPDSGEDDTASNFAEENKSTDDAVTDTKEELESVDVNKPNVEQKEEKSPTCTIKIVCDTILNNKGDLTPGKEGYVPASGVILSTTEAVFEEGETVFDVLQRVCTENQIQIEYAYTPIYESYYIEGINHIYEFDCGPESGWMYKVNGWFPNYGCSSYYVEEGDSIVWCYSCKGLGADVGGSNF